VSVSFELDGRTVEVDDDTGSLLDALRGELGVHVVKDGCSPQGQCGCCTVLIDGQPRVSCVTPVRRVSGRSVTTLDGLPEPVRETWGAAFAATGASQCGFCSPGIITRLEGLRQSGAAVDDRRAVERALAAHLCRCTGWQPVHEAWDRAMHALGSAAAGAVEPGEVALAWPGDRDVSAAERRATLEGRADQRVGPRIALGHGGFADDDAPADALVAVPDGQGGWSVAASLAAARAVAGKVQGRRTSAPSTPPLDAPDGAWAVTLATSWVEPAYVETDATWCSPGGDPRPLLGNGGAFGGKTASELPAVARRLADEHGRAVRVVLAREDVVQRGPKRPPLAAGVRADGTGVLRVVRTPGIAEAVASVAPGLVVEEVDAAGPVTSCALRGAGWVEAAVLVAAATGADRIVAPWGSWASATVGDDGSIGVRVGCGSLLDEVVLRSYCIGAAHQALGWVTSESLSVTGDGDVLDLTVRSFGVVAASLTPPVSVTFDHEEGTPVNGSDAVFAAVALAVWRHQGLPPAWPTGVPLRER
jgi:aerobic-type carbon monoxide dehydrogenase small subunit (CoxS/CutS family)